MSGDPDGDGVTTSTSTRWNFTNDLLAGVLVVGSILLACGFIALGRPIPTLFRQVLAVEVLLAVIWAFGTRATQALQNLPIAFQSGGQPPRRPPQRPGDVEAADGEDAAASRSERAQEQDRDDDGNFN